MFIDRKWCLCTLFPDITLYHNIKSAIAHSNNCVEGFFIIAGFLIVLTFKPTVSMKNFILKKYIRLSPVILFSMGICFLGFLLGTMEFNWVANILTVLLVNQFVVKFAIGQNPILWYTSTLFTSMLIYFCIIKYLPQKVKIPLITGLVIIGYGIVELLQHGSFANPLKNYHSIFNIGFLRALGGVGTGCLVGIWFKMLINQGLPKFNIPNFIKNNKILITPVELCLLSYVVWWCVFIHNKVNNLCFVLAFVILLIMFVLKKGYLSEFFDRDIWVKLGRFQYSVYVIHYVIIRIFGLAVFKTHPEFVVSHPVLPIFIMLSSVIIIGIFTYYMVELPCANYLKKKLKL